MVQLVVAWPLILPSPTDLTVVYYLVVLVVVLSYHSSYNRPDDTVICCRPLSHRLSVALRPIHCKREVRCLG